MRIIYILTFLNSHKILYSDEYWFYFIIFNLKIDKPMSVLGIAAYSMLLTTLSSIFVYLDIIWDDMLEFPFLLLLLFFPCCIFIQFEDEQKRKKRKVLK